MDGHIHPSLIFLVKIEACWSDWLGSRRRARGAIRKRIAERTVNREFLIIEKSHY
jgi:hypothetical protein